MKQNLIIPIRLTFICIVIFAFGYSFIMFGIAQAVPGHGEGKLILKDNQVVGFSDVGQKFTADQYFNSRPSAVDYNAAGSGGSNKGPSNPDYLQQVKDRIDSFLVHNPSVKKEEIPSDLVTASGSGLDPDISPEAALVQVDRISKLRKVSSDKLIDLIKKQQEKPFFGPAHLNVLRLNIELDKMK